MTAIGDRFRNLHPELDGADSSDVGVCPYTDENGERTTPAGKLWRIADINHVDSATGGTVYDLVCDETGAWICPTDAELASDFVKEPM